MIGSHRPFWSRVSTTETAGRPARNSSTNRRRASSPHGSGSGAEASELVERAALDAGVVPGGGHGDPQHQQRVDGGIGAGGQRHRALAQHHAGGDVAVLPEPARNGPSSEPSTRAHRSSLTQAMVRAAVDERPHEVVGVGVAERSGHAVLLLEQQPVAGALGAAVELDPRRQHGLVGRGDLDVVARQQGHLGGAGPA